MSSNLQLTKDGIAYDFRISPYKVVINYDVDDYLEFIFSSNLYKTKFEDKLLINRSKINESLSKRFGIKTINDKLSDIKLYSTIEKRGFLIKLNEMGIECLSNLTLDGNNLIIKN